MINNQKYLDPYADEEVGIKTQPSIAPKIAPPSLPSDKLDPYAEEEQEELKKAKESEDLLTRAGITGFTPRFIAGLIAAPYEVGKGAYDIVKGIGKITGAKAGKLPELPKVGAGWGYGAGAILSPLGGVLGLATKAISKAGKVLSPTAHAEEVLATLGKGMSSRENAQFLLNRLKAVYDTHLDKYKEMLWPVEKAAGNTHLYDAALHPELITKSKYPLVLPEDFKYTPDLKIIHNNFVSNPIFENAHNLQKQLGREIGNLQTSRLDQAGIDRLQNFRQAREAISNDIGNFLIAKDPNIAKQFINTAQYYRKNVVPFINNPKMAKLLTKEGKFAEKAKIEPSNVTDLFQVPLVPTAASQSEVEAGNIVKTSIEKIIQDMGEDIKPHILYSELTKYGKVSPEKLLEKADLEKLSQKGLDIYHTPETVELFRGLQTKIKKAKIAKWGAGIVGAPALTATGYKLYKTFSPDNRYKAYSAPEEYGPEE